jgi:hypothetical protein
MPPELQASLALMHSSAAYLIIQKTYEPQSIGGVHGGMLASRCNIERIVFDRRAGSGARGSARKCCRRLD